MAEACKYYMKRVGGGNGKPQQCVAMQSANGPCPLLALCNCLFLSHRAEPPPSDQAWTDTPQLASIVAEVILSVGQRSSSSSTSSSSNTTPNLGGSSHGLDANLEKNISDAVALLPTLQSGLDVNVMFDGTFEYTPQISLFDLTGFRLFHAWIADPQREGAAKLRGLSYNEAVVKAKDDPLIKGWLGETSALQCTTFGLFSVAEQIREGELAVLFRANHFSVVHKHKGKIYTLVTDEGYSKSDVMWEWADANVDGDSLFYTADFLPYEAPGTTVVTSPLQQQEQQQQQQQQQSIKKQKKSDHQLAVQLQQAEEDTFMRANALNRRRRAQAESDDCVLL